MIATLKGWAKRRWPRLSLRTYLFATLFLVAALPGVGAVALRVYENTLVRQTEAELVAQGAAMAALAASAWPGARPAPPGPLRPEPPRIDLNATPILPPRPDPVPAPLPDPAARAVAASFAPVAAATRRTTLAGIVLTDRAGRVVSGERAGTLADLPEVRAALSGWPATTLRRNAAYRQVYRFEWLSRAAAIRVHHARPVVVNGQVVGVVLLSRSARALFRGLYEDRGKIAVGIVAIFLMLIVLTALLSRGIARPIEALGRATREVAAGGGGVPEPPATAAIEIRALYDDFAVMADRIDRRARYLRDFAHAVAHEFKTPLAGIRGAVELLEDHAETMTEAERDRFLANIAADADRLSQLTGRLLELARADMAAAAPDARTPLAPLLAAFAAHQGGLRIATSGDGVAAAAPDVISAVLETLADNSRQAGATGLVISVEPADDRLRLTVADDGPGVPTGDRARLFQPFFTSRRSAGGTGLGLPIARSLLAANGATIELAERDGGAVFLIDLPAADRFSATR